MREHEPTPIHDTVQAEVAREALARVKEACRTIGACEVRSSAALISMAEALAAVDALGWREATGTSREAWVRANLIYNGKPMDPGLVSRWVTEWVSTEDYPEVRDAMHEKVPLPLSNASMACRVGKASGLSSAEVLRMARQNSVETLRANWKAIKKEVGLDSPEDQPSAPWPVIVIGKVDPSVYERRQMVIKRLFSMDGEMYDAAKTSATKAEERIVGFIDDVWDALRDAKEFGDSRKLAALIDRMP